MSCGVGGSRQSVVVMSTAAGEHATTQTRNRTVLVLAAGSYSAVCETLVVQPLDFLKVRLQLAAPIVAADGTLRRPSMFQTIRNTFTSFSGGIRTCYRGVVPELAGVLPTTAILFVVNDALREAVYRNGILAPSTQPTLPSHPQPQQSSKVVISPAQALLCGGLAGIPEASLLGPFQLVKIRMQSAEHLARYSNSWSCARSILRTEGGPRGMLRGTAATIYRNSVWNGVYFGVIQLIKKHAGDSHSPATGFLIDLFGGSIGGMIATSFNIPFDVAKTRIQSQIPHRYVSPPPDPAKPIPYQYRSVFGSLRHIYKTEGLTALYRGFVPKLMRMGVGGGVCIASYDQALRFFGIAEH